MPDRPISRRNALLGGAALVGGFCLSAAARATAPTPAGRVMAQLTPRQQAGQRVVFSYPPA